MHFSLKHLAIAAFAANLGSAYVIPQFFQEAFKQEDPIEYLPEQKETHDDDNSVVGATIPKPHVPYFMKPHVESEKLQDKIKLDDLNATAWDLYHMANHSTSEYGHPTRVIGSKGHNKTMEYILNAFDDMQDYYDVSLQKFDALSGKIISFNLSDVETGHTFANTTAFALSPPVDGFIGKLVEIPNLGCAEKDYASLVHPGLNEKQIAIIERDKCPFLVTRPT